MYTKDRVPVGRKSIEVKPDKNTPDNFLGIGKKAKARKAVRVAQRQEKRAVKIDMKKARVADKLSKADSRIKLADQGIVQPTGVGAIGGAIAGLLGGGNQQQDSTGAVDNSQGMGDVTPSASTLPTVVTPAQLAPSQIGITAPVKDTTPATGGGGFQDDSGGGYTPDYSQQDTTSGGGYTPQPEGKKDNTMLYIIIVVAAVVLFFFLRKK